MTMTAEEILAKMQEIVSAPPKQEAAPPPNVPLPSEPHPTTHPVAQADEQPIYTWDQLQQAVQENKITEGVAHEVWATQNRRLAVQEATSSVMTQTQARSTAAMVEAEIAKYRNAIPQVLDPSSEQRQRVVREFNRLTGLGFDKHDLKTELAALQASFGTVEQVIKAVKPKPEGHREISSDGSAPSETGDPKSTAPSSLTEDEKRYYDNAISRGLYKDWTEVREEMKFANPKTRRRYGATA